MAAGGSEVVNCGGGAEAPPLGWYLPGGWLSNVLFSSSGDKDVGHFKQVELWLNYGISPYS